MTRIAILTCLVLSLSGCMAVIGYEPTAAELEAIRHGEDPRANEDANKQQGNAGESGERVGNHDTRPGAMNPVAENTEGPSQGTVLRWLDSATVVIEADSHRETVALAGQTVDADPVKERDALDARMERWTYGTAVRLQYPLKDKQGEIIYRDADGRLIATIQ
ncbi:MAG: hypothetical protein KDB82_05675 [Planctomycetes bacterium]|nr:hypothetical protein [Planctomycetota bacterium]